ncbi:MAG: DUF559 domain-containing protein [Nanoarchaeota archaeon]|nr:DUF559 domain-containing protein [Nanoarchaeota archaeon]
MNERRMKWDDPEWRRRQSEIVRKSMADPILRKRLSESHKGKKLSEEHRRKIAERNVGRKTSLGTKIKISLANKGKLRSEDVRKKMSKMRKGQHRSPSTEFKKGLIPWNKGKKGVMPVPWNKGTKGLQNAWNKGVLGVFHHDKEAKIKIKKARAKQVFPIKDSKPELKIQVFLSELNIEFISHKYMEIEHAYMADIFIPSKNLVIEIDGDYWHGNSSNPKYKVLNKSQLEQVEEDKIRTKELTEKGFRVLRLWESNIENMNLQDFIKRINI